MSDMVRIALPGRLADLEPSLVGYNEGKSRRWAEENDYWKVGRVNISNEFVLISRSA